MHRGGFGSLLVLVQQMLCKAKETVHCKERREAKTRRERRRPGGQREEGGRLTRRDLDWE